MGKRLSWLWTILGLLVLLSLGVAAYGFWTTAPLESEAALCRNVKQVYGWDVTQVHAFQEDQGAAALLAAATPEEDPQSPQTVMFLFERSWLPGRWRVSGCGWGTSPLGSYQYFDQGKGIIVVYGDNREVGADSYLFSLGNTLYGQRSLGDYVLGVHVIPHTESGSLITWYDEKGNEINIGGDIS